MANEVVAHYLNGRIVKGVSLDVDPGRPKFHVRTDEAEGSYPYALPEPGTRVKPPLRRVDSLFRSSGAPTP